MLKITSSFMSLALGAGLLAAGATTANARDRITIVGSSTVFPFSTTVAERFGKSTKFKTPIVESTGSGGGLKLFCSGKGDQHPDITNASRRIKPSEVARCAKNGITDTIEVKIGYDGIVLANSRRSKLLNLTLKDLFLALARNVPDGNGKTKPNPYRTWKNINPTLPELKIEVMGPPPTSGTRDAFVELAMEGGCKSFPWIKALKKKDKKAYKALCHTIRSDGAYIEAGENDNLIVQKLEANPTAFGIFGFSYLDQNTDKIQGNTINGIEPGFEQISDGSYPVSRSLYFYVKKSRIGKVPGIEEFMAAFTNDKAWGEEGYLSDKGLIPMSEKERKEWAGRVKKLQKLAM
ncbi:MAG: PstS family phosphate ABC transporter substrate-binding protein [Hyphomicrobiaceae bacterium]|nr:PstS family phosphate ABC transporter substrate-binding protein [Hyphomicrobiaceae bacterium]